jgi:hypothetical protein
MSKWGRTADAVHAAALASHAACCGLPLLLNGLALAFGAGLLTLAWPWMDGAHGLIHAREGLLLSVSAGFVGLGGVTQYMSWRADCGRDVCAHEPCAPRKPRRVWMYAAVCALFLGNLALYAWHQDRAADAHAAAQVHAQA